MMASPTPEPKKQPAEHTKTDLPLQVEEQGKKPAQQQAKKTKPSQPITAGSWVFLIILLLILFALPAIWWRGLGVLAVAETFLRQWLHTIVLIALPLMVAITCWSQASHRTQKLRPSERNQDSRLKKLSRTSIAASTIALLGGTYAFTIHPYLVAQSFTANTQTVEQTTTYADRAPWVVANNYAQRDQGDVIGDREDVHYVPAPQDAKATAGDGTGQGTSRYTVLVKERGVFGTGGYQAIQTLTMPTTGTIPADASTYCEMPDNMNKRLDTNWPWHSLAWSIHTQAPFAHFNTNDAYGYCTTNNTPIVVIPLWAYQGFWNVTQKPNGAAIYTETGLEILTPEQLIERGIQGPTYPRSLAQTQRESINAGGTLMQWWGSKYGYDLTDTDEEDSNAENPAEFTMVNPTNAQLSYITPLTPRGSSQSITAVSVVPAQQSIAQRAPLVVNASTDLPSTSTLETAIKESSVSGDNAWTTRWSAGMTVYEILPAKNGHWAASIGQGQAVSYRADIAPDGKVTVVNAETGQTSGRATLAENQTVTVDSGKPLNQMTENELLQLIQQATAELQKRNPNN